MLAEAVLWLSRLAALANLITAFFTCWYLAGSDDVPRNRVAPPLGLGVLLFALAAVVVSFGVVETTTAKTVTVMAMPAVLAVVATPFAGTVATGRPGVATMLKPAGLLVLPAVLFATSVSLDAAGM